MPPPKPLSAWWGERGRWLAWKLRHPRGRYHDYYVERVTARLDEGQVHVSLGCRSPEHARHAAAGRAVLKRLVSLGLRPEHRVVDYGCGSLRIGRHLIDFLAADRYVGLDVTERFWRDGLRNLDPECTRRKRPRFALVEGPRPEPPDFLVSIGVLIHVPAQELSLYLDGIQALIGPRTLALVTFFDDEDHRRLSEMTWTWPAERVVSALAARGLAAQVSDFDAFPAPPGRRLRLLTVRRAGADVTAARGAVPRADRARSR